MIHKLETALAEGGHSTTWHELRSLLPQDTFHRFAVFAHVADQPRPLWANLRRVFDAFADQRVRIGKLAVSTVERYNHTFSEFETFLSERNVSLLQDISFPLVEEFKVWRVERIRKRKQSRGATGAVLDVAILHRIFAFGVKRELLQKNPVQMEGRPGDNPEGGAGDTIETVEKHYMPFVRELRDRVRKILETGSELEGLAAATSQNAQCEAKESN